MPNQPGDSLHRNVNTSIMATDSKPYRLNETKMILWSYKLAVTDVPAISFLVHQTATAYDWKIISLKKIVSRELELSILFTSISAQRQHTLLFFNGYIGVGREGDC